MFGQHLRHAARTFAEQPGFTAAAVLVRAFGVGIASAIAYRGSASLFTVLRVPPLLGRTFTAADDRTAAERVVVLSYPFWQRRFDGDAAIVGRMVRLDGAPATVTGVLPVSFVFAHAVYVRLPLTDAVGAVFTLAAAAACAMPAFRAVRVDPVVTLRG